VADSLRCIDSNVKPIFLCTTRDIDKVILDPTGYEYITQPIVPPVRTVGGLLKFWKSWRETKDLVRKVLRERKPSAVLGLGGYAAGVAVRVAAMHGMATALLNPDVIPGKANQYLMRFVKAAFCQFAQTKDHVSPANHDKIRVTGCAIRKDLTHLPDKESAAKRLGIEANLQTLVITGASQGARTVNEAVIDAINSMDISGWQILHLSGAEHAEAVRAGYREIKIGATVIDFTPAMADVWAVADLTVCRAGASTCAELTACGVPAILMPYPYHKDMHQRANAKVLTDAGAAILLDDLKERKQNAQNLRPILESLMRDATRRQSMSEKAKSLAHPDAADVIAKEILTM
jgi:UDP-N-acetylglucosamine--N-acetylmuramyl-(pentapeptide) pyrophosphoryl-undecaprenol N-acetylglucosamine transferase